MTPRLVWINVVKDLARLRRDPVAVATWIGIPLVLGVMMNVIFGGSGGGTPHGRLLVADEDHSFASGILTVGFRSESLKTMFTLENVTASDGRARIDRGDASALLVIPAGMQRAVGAHAPFHVQLFVNPSEQVLPKIIEQVLSTTLETGFPLQPVGGPLRDLKPRLIRLETSAVEERRPPPPNFAALFFPASIFMALLFVANGLAAEIWKEQAQGTLRRMAVSPAPFEAFLGGRVITVAIVLCGVTAVGLAAMRWLAHTPVSNLPVAALWAVVTGSTFYLLLLVAVMHASSQRAAGIIGNLIIMPLAMIGGAFFPFEIMPEWMARIGRLTPNGWALTQFKAMVDGTSTAASQWAGFAALAALCAVAFLLAARRLKGGFLT